MSEAVLTRIRHLVALAGSSEEQEARSAAVQACRLIREHEVELVWADGKKLDDEERSLFDDISDFLDTIGVPAAPSRTYPFDPFTAPFRVVANYAKERGVEMHDRGEGRYAARINGETFVGSWPEVVRVVFTRIESASGSSSRRGTGR